MVLILLAAPDLMLARDLSFEERVKAQEAIERVYYSHQLGTTERFEQAVPRNLMERRVRTYLKQSAALEKFWNTSVTSEALQRELERIAGATRTPERLQEIYDALGGDPFVIQECFARATLVDRLSRSFFAADAKLHGEARDSDWSQWWRGTQEDLDEHAVRSVAAGLSVLPVPGKKPQHPFPGEGRSGISAGSPGTTDAAAPLDACLQDAWENGSLDDPPFPASHTSAVWTGTEMIVWGGYDPGSSPVYADRGARYDPLTDSWAPTSKTDARAYHTAVWTGSRMLIWGGVGPSNGGELLHTGAAYDPATDSWTPLSTVNDPGPRHAHTAAWTGSRMLVWGGTNVDSLSLGDGRSYDPGTDQWTLIPSSPLVEARSAHTAIWSGTEMIVWGGYHNSDSSRLNTGGRYNPSTNMWLATSTASGLQGRYGHTAVWSGTEMIVWGGGFGDGARYNPANDSWQSMALTDAPSFRHHHVAIWTGARMLIWGGTGDAGLKLNSGARYDPGNDSWTAMSSSNAPSPRLYHVAVWSGAQMVVWGGEGNGGVSLETGGRDDPVADAWTATATQPLRPPAGPAVWTGSLLVTWTGTSQGVSLTPAVGARYDPLTDSWSGITTSGAPTSRLNHTAIWTGSKMVIWGGRGSISNNIYINDGGRYDPIGDSWLPTSIVGQVPVARASHTAVWTGIRMLVWGGYNVPFQAAVDLNSGGSYDPAGDTWTALSTTDAPAARSNHTAIWTGTKMIIYGGGRPNSPLNSGGIYNPAGDSWTETSQVGAPSPRVDNTNVWTGARMMIWGGKTAGFPSVLLNTGGTYDPATNSWSMTSPNGAPLARTRHSGVWTGSNVVIWGGFVDEPGGSASTRTGAAYNPATDRWFPTSLQNAPAGMSDHAAVWADSGMIVWGGPNPGGGRYVVDQGPDLDNDFYPVCAEDCDDTDPLIYPGAAEICNSVDDNCNAQIDEGFDGDGDGFTSCGGDCNDSSAAVNPSAGELCNGVDDNCNNAIDEGFPDGDADGYALCKDCNDANSAVHPGAAEICNGIDDNCNTQVDEGFADLDSDGFSFCVDCNDGDATVHPGASEFCNLVDDNCDTNIDEGFDQDGDGVSVCSSDCNDADPNSWDLPFEVPDLVSQQTSPLTWSWFDEAPFIGPGVSYQVPSGTLGPGSGINFQSANCLGTTAVPEFVDARPDPPISSSYWYLVRARNSCGVGTYGVNSLGMERLVPACP
jgi:N-acetylneuraminic acid mutarotase